MRGSDLLAEMLVREGVETIFTLMSEEITSFTATLRTRWDDEVDVVQTRHEQSAVAMADGYARTGGEIGVAAVGRGPAVAQTGTALVTAQKSGSDVLVVVPERPRAATVDHLNKEFRQQSYLETLVDTVLSVRSEDAFVPKLADAFFRLHNGDGPVVVQIPWDLLDSEVGGTDDWQRKLDEARQRTASDARLHPERAGIREAVDL
ncbi:thiamine pyrophosphate-binding protein, partial [Halobium palmae]